MAVALLVAWRVATLAMADYYAGVDPEQALEWRADHPEALLQLAEQAIDRHDPDAATSLAQRALAVDPLDGRGYRVLAEVALAQGDRKRQAELIALAVKHSPRDLQARAWAAQIALEHGDAASGIAHYDRVLRMAPELQPTVFPVLAALAALPEGRAALVTSLAADPPWRSAWLAHYSGTAANAGELRPLYRALREKGGLIPEENAAYIGRFVRDRQWDAAFIAWADGLPPAQLAQLATPFDGNFESASSTGGPFEWTIRSVFGVDAAVLPLPDGEGHGLRVEFQGRRSAFSDVRQLLLLPPGSAFQLNWRSRFENLETSRGLHWTLKCAEGSGGSILATPPAADTSPWQAQTASFSVPADCPAQWLVLELDARIAAETLAMGTAWFDDVKVVAIPAPAVGPTADPVVE